MRIPTAHSTNSLERFLQHMQYTPKPHGAISPDYLKTNGFISGNDPELRHIFRLLGFLDSEYVPTKRWTDYSQKGKEVLKEAILELYKELFKLFSDPTALANTELQTWFRPPLTGGTRSSVDRAIRTFRKLCQFAGMTPDDRIKPDVPAELKSSTPTPSSHTKLKSQPNFQLPVLAGKPEYKALFEAMKEVFHD